MSSEVSTILDAQDGVISRRQVLGAGLAPHYIRQMLRRRVWVRVHDGVYVNHTGALNWQQRAWAAVLFAAPAALCHGSAIRAGDGVGRRDRADESPIHVAVDRRRSVAAPNGVVVHHLSDLDTKVQWNLSPPRQRIEHALLDIAAGAADDFSAIATLSAAIQERRTTAGRIQSALATRRRISRRAFLDSVLTDLIEGTCSVLEHGYLVRVERPHGLPRASRQVSANPRGQIYRDVEYDEFSLVVELDGRQFHDNATARDDDLDRDLDAAVERKVTLRLGWGQVFARHCLTAARVGAVLQQRGWTGVVSTCPSCPQS